ncbi:hypothetical protein EDD36DRAFT_309518 [Exophiala viscosa]|uniref:DUF7025 domain-containing protein n=1 Tax=Exophiala viscosa TaxID=2486360 RepID=A0AAN6IAT7_9EURO|nr:hypothetical protein EDD36DRAFT_309518 [Exophiala viscosa]
MQLMLLERQNRKRLMMERQELDDLITMTGRGLATGLGSPSFDGEARSLGSHNKQELPSVVAGLQRVLGVSDTSQLDLVKLEEYIGLLQRQVKQLEADRKDQPPSRLQILNRIRETHYISRKGRTEVETKLSMPYFDEPEWVLGQGAERQLQCKLPLHNFDLYLEKNKDVSFIVYRNFDPFLVDNAGLRTTNRGNRGAGLLPELHPQPNSETIQPISQALISAIENILGTREEYSTVLQQFQLSRELKAPYLFIYHSRKDLDAIQENFSPEACKEVSLLLDYIKSQYGDKYATADALFERGKITSDYIHYVFKPGDILVQREDGRYKAFVATGWPSMGSIKYASRLGSRAIQDRGLPLYGTEEASMRIRHEKIKLQDWSVTGWHWAFDGNFQREHSSHYFDIEVEKVDKWDNATSSSAWQKRRMEEPKPKESEITDLQVFPIKYANADLVDTLRKRGSTFWKCRNRRLVSYMQTDRFGAQNMVSRPK